MTNGRIPHIELIVGDNELMFEEDTRDGGNVLVEMVCARARPNEIFTRHVRQIALDFEVEGNRKEG